MVVQISFQATCMLFMQFTKITNANIFPEEFAPMQIPMHAYICFNPFKVGRLICKTLGQNQITIITLNTHVCNWNCLVVVKDQ